MSSWAEDVDARISELTAERAGFVKAGRTDQDLQPFDLLLTDAKKARDSHNPFSGITPRASKTWVLLQDAEQKLDELETDLDHLVERAKRHADRSLNERLTAWQREFDTAADNARKLELARQLIREAHEADSSKHSSERNNARGLVVSSVLVMAILAILFLVQANVPSLVILPAPTETPVDGLPLLGLVYIFGALGGLMSGFVGLYLVGAGFTDTRWHDPRPPLMLAKVALGMATALIGCLIIGTKLLVGTYTSLAAVLLLALMFGFGQLAVTTFLDKSVKKILSTESKK
ncbi:hypothetical protein [Arthrobacter sp. 92]|uniref:hypothetical protein n=1 Tax=Arthrobacter sp. 92 TaxID=3418175 RepID=UPI003D08E31B